MFSISNLFSQGFDWQYSARLPYKLPKLFIGGYLGIGIANNTGKFTFLEDHIPCCDYESGYGDLFNLGATSEFWINGNTALSLSANYLRISSNFQKNIEVPRSTGNSDYIATYKYYLDESRDYLGIDMGIKKRIFTTNFSFGGKISLDYLVSNTASHKEKIISPDHETFIDGSTERIITNGILRKFNKLILTPQVFLNYDINLGKGYYSSVKLYATLPIMSVIEVDEWNEWKIGLNVSFLKSY